MRPRPHLLCALLPALVGLLGLGAVPAGAQQADIVDGRAHVSIDLTNVRVEGSAAAAAQAVYDEVASRLAQVVAARIAAEAELTELAARDVALTATIATETTNRKAAGVALVEARRAVEQAAVANYVVSTTYDDVARFVDLDSNVEIGIVQTYTDASREDRQAVEEAARIEVDRASRTLDAAQVERIGVRDRTVVVTAQRDQAAVQEADLNVELEQRAVERDAARATSRVAGMDFTLVALDAYWRAAASQQACGIEWWALAGISRVEGRHGTYGGAHLEPDGDVSRSIIGIPLTGASATRVVTDTDGGALDGDLTYDRAVGPMQFIPSTWSRWKRDGDGDGDTDPQNIYDATAAAAAYLCHGRNLDSEEGLRAGYFSYNHSPTYVEAVLGYAYRYRGLQIARALSSRRVDAVSDPDFRSIDITADVFEYLVAHGTPADDTYIAIREETIAATGVFAGMQIGADQYALLTLLVRLVGTRLAVEVGTFTGTSAVAIASGLDDGGRLVCCDISEEWTAIARKHWAAAGLADRIDLRLAPATETIASFPADPPIDFAFVDADKPSYIEYYEALVPRLRPGGLLVADNVLWSGRVVDPSADDDNTEAIRRFNDHVVADPRCDTVMLAVGDGITLCRKQ